MKNYQPELGQSMFGQPWKEYKADEQVDIVLTSIRNAMLINQSEFNDSTPFDNSGLKFKNDVFEVNAYDWSECKCNECWENGWSKELCKCGWSPQEYNFKWRDFEVSWYKYLGRGMSQNRPISKSELTQMLNECLNSIIQFKT